MTAFYAAHPFWASIAGLLLIGWITITGLAFIGLGASIFAHLQKPKTKEIIMKNRILLVILLACGLGAITFLASCSTLGNGTIEVPVDIDLVYHDNFGNGFTLLHGELEEATYRSVKTGVLYQYTTDTGKGTFRITEPRSGAIIRLRRKENPSFNHASPQNDPPSPSARQPAS